ncbi:MAG: toprim domain-containing protein [Candidatus Thorarchaeota archaeon]
MSEEKDKTLRDKVEIIYRARDKERESSRGLRENEKSLIKLIQKLDNYEGIIVVVEGKRDEHILRSLGMHAPIVKTQHGLPRPELLDDIASRAGNDGQVLILTDFDDEGIEICKFIEKGLELKRIRVLQGLRLEIRKAMGNWRCIEEMVALFKRKDSPEPSPY